MSRGKSLIGCTTCNLAKTDKAVLEKTESEVGAVIFI